MSSNKVNFLTKYANKTLSLFSDKYKTVNEFLVIYKDILTSKQITKKTINNRLRYLHYLEEEFGERALSSIQPHEVQKLVSRLLKQHESTAKRVMIEAKGLFNEAKGLFNEAMNYRWITFNPMASIRLPKVKVKRKRITLQQFKLIAQDCKDKSPPWVWHMLMLAVLTGQRRSDLMKMKFSFI